MGKDAPAEVKQAFGHYVIEFSFLEFIVQFFTWQVIAGEQIEDILLALTLTSGETFGRMVDICTRVVDLRAPDDAMRSRFDALLPRLREAGTERNQILHAFWAWDDNSGLYALRMGARNPNTGQTTVADITRRGDELTALGNDFASFASAFLRARGKGPSTPPATEI